MFLFSDVQFMLDIRFMSVLVLLCCVVFSQFDVAALKMKLNVRLLKESASQSVKVKGEVCLYDS